MPISRTPPGSTRGEPLSIQVSSYEGSSKGIVTTAINALPLDVGIVISPTLPKSGQGSSTCLGGPGNPVCGLEVRGDQQGVQCDICGAWYHAQCQKLSKAAYNALAKHDILAFICDSCRKRPNLGNLQPKSVTTTKSVQTETIVSDALTLSPEKDAEMLSRLAAAVKSLESMVSVHDKLLTESKKTLETMSQQQVQSKATFAEVVKAKTQPVTDGRQNVPQTTDYRHIMRAELREMEERKKRISSLVVRGLRVGSADEAATKFGDVVYALTGKRTTWSEVCRIRNDTDLFRGNVHDSQIRRLILDEAKNLRDSQYSHVFIRRDLTFQQRQELRDKFTPRSQSQSQRVGKESGAPTRQEPNTHHQKQTTLSGPRSSDCHQEIVPIQMSTTPGDPPAGASGSNGTMGPEAYRAGIERLAHPPKSTDQGPQDSGPGGDQDVPNSRILSQGDAGN